MNLTNRVIGFICFIGGLAFGTISGALGNWSNTVFAFIVLVYGMALAWNDFDKLFSKKEVRGIL